MGLDDTKALFTFVGAEYPFLGVENNTAGRCKE
jgi:hypothetical protein